MKRRYPFIKHKSTYCPKCGNEDSLVYYNVNGTPLPHISNYTVADVMRELKVSLSHMRCNICGTVYYIDYSSHYPRAVYPQEIRDDMFM